MQARVPVAAKTVLLIDEIQQMKPHWNLFICINIHLFYYFALLTMQKFRSHPNVGSIQDCGVLPNVHSVHPNVQPRGSTGGAPMQSSAAHCNLLSCRERRSCMASLLPANGNTK